MRSSIRLGLAAACLWAAGCATPGKKADSADASPRPFTGAALTRPGPRDPASPPPEVDNLLAGQVIDRAFNRRLANASIQVVDLQDPNPAPAAKLDVKANSDGYFFIPGLQRGHHYQLIGRISDGSRVLSGVTLAEPPNPRLSIYVSEDYTSPTTPAPLAPPQTPAKPSAEKEPGRTPGAPSAALDPPTPVKPHAGPAASPPALNRIADNPDAGGFPKAPPAPKVDIPSAPVNPIIPPTPPLVPSGPPAGEPPGVDQASHGGPPLRTAPPFCVLVGKHLDNFSLPDVDGNSWEFRRDPPRRLVLVDFWKTNCGPCLSAVPRLRALQQKYGQDGLEVVGIAYEDVESPAQRQFNVRAARTRLGINYTLLMGADSRAGACPVRSQFLVDSFPRLVLIDGGGDILWRSSPQGLSGSEFQDLERQINWTLHPPAR